MITIVRAALLAALVASGVSAAAASPAILLADTAVREGPGDEYRHIWDLVAGTHVDVRECKATQWCYVVRRDKEGWVHLEGLDLYPGVASESGSDTASSSGGGGSSGSSSSSGGSTSSSSGSGKPQRGSSSSSGGGSSSSGGEAIASTPALGGSGGGSTLSPPCTRCAH